MELLKALCQAVRSKLSGSECKLLLIIDDVWPEDFELFERNWLGLDSLHGGSACVITSRDRGLVMEGGDYECIPLEPVDPGRAQRILYKHALLHATEANVAPDVSVRIWCMALVHDTMSHTRRVVPTW